MSSPTAPRLVAPQPEDILQRTPTVRWAVIPLVGGTAVWWEFAPDLDLARHNHPHAQIVIVLEGSIDLIFDNGAVTVGPGQTLPIAPHVYHGARTGPDGLRVVDVFIPARDEYEAEYNAAHGA